ncbi:MAG: dihydropteroate synthase [Sphingomonadaceae bacterium]
MSLYFRPTAFVDAPFGHDGQVLRLAGGLVWFSAVEIIRTEGGRRVEQRLVPIERLDAELDEEGQALLARITAPRAPLTLGERVIRLDQPSTMAILNVTPDSFSDGGRHVDDPQAAAAAGVAMAEAGAAIIDAGGESTRPGAAMVWEGDEIARVAPVIERLARAGVAVSADTRKAAVMRAALDAGAGLVNDVSALTHDAEAMALIAQAGCPVVLMHHQGTPQDMQKDPRYADVLLEVYDWLAARVAVAEAAGIARARILIDPGIGFGKTIAHNLALLNGLSLFHGLGCAIVLGASRKRIIGALDNEASAERRLGGSIALVMKGAEQGVQLLRVHDVQETVQALKIWRGTRDEALTPRGG